MTWSWIKRFCIFCGDETYFPPTCGSHRDLLVLDPHVSTAKAPRREL